MQLFTPLAPDPTAPLARAHPLARLTAALALMAALFVSIDPLTPALVVVLLLAAVPLSGIGTRALLRRAWPIVAVAMAIGAVNVVFAPPGGVALIWVGPVVVWADALITGVALALRLTAIALAGLLALAPTEPIDLVDALIGQLHVSPRFAAGAMAAVRLLPVLAEERQTIALARRARGIEAGRSPVAAVTLEASVIFGLLVAAIRRATRLALAMEARGLGSRECHTLARPRHMRPTDWAWVAAAIFGGAASVAVSVALGSWRFLLG